MNTRLSLLSVFLPSRVKKKKLQELLDITAEAFQISPPHLGKSRFDELLELYALLTSKMAQRYSESEEEVKQVKERLHDGAVRIGERFREELKIRTRKDSMAAAGLLYRAIGIDFRYDESGGVTIRQCYFSEFYSCEVCWIISSLDEGIIEGLSGGGRLSFFSRMTEGNKMCVGAIDFGRNDML